MTIPPIRRSHREAFVEGMTTLVLVISFVWGYLLLRWGTSIFHGPAFDVIFSWQPPGMWGGEMWAASARLFAAAWFRPRQATWATWSAIVCSAIYGAWGAGIYLQSPSQGGLPPLGSAFICLTCAGLAWVYGQERPPHRTLRERVDSVRGHTWGRRY